jgi:hypothetical protein
MTTRRPLVAALVTLCGLAITAGAFLPWVDARGTRPASGITHTSLLALRHFAYADSAVTASFAVAVAATGILVLTGGLAAWRWLTGVFAAMALAAAGLWTALNARHYDPTGLRYNDLRAGAWLTVAGGVVALAVTAVMRRRDASADTSPWDSDPWLAEDDPDAVPAPARPAPGWQPGPWRPPAGPQAGPRYPPPRYPPQRRPPWVQDPDGFRVPR